MKRIVTLYKNAYSGLAPSTWLLCLVMLVNRSGTMVIPFMTLYLTQKMHFTISSAGFVVALFGAGAVCGGFIGGRLTDKIGFYYVQLMALVGGGIMFLILGQINNYTGICAVTFVLSLINESFRPANASAIAHYSKAENRTRSYSLNRLSINLGWAVGGAVGGILAAKNYHLLFWVDGLTNIGAAFLLWFFLSPSKNKATAKRSDIIIQTSNSAYRDKIYLGFIVLTILFAYCFFQIFTTLPVFLKKDLHLSESYIGMIMALNGLLIVIFEMVTVHNLEGKRNSLHYVPIGVLFCAISFVLFNLLPGVLSLAFLFIILVTVGEILSMPFMNSFWISRTNSANRGQYAGLYTVAWSTAQVMGPATGSIIAERFGFTTLWWVIGAVCTLSAVGFKYLHMLVMEPQLT